MSLESTLVSIVIPVHNGERFLERTLASALAQTYNPIEVIVVDDGSTDQTPSVVEAAASHDGRVRFFRMAKTGVAAARNLGIAKSHGQLVAPLDADDLWHPEKIARQAAVMRASPATVGLVYCWSVDIDENDFLIHPIRNKSTIQGQVTSELAKGNFLENSSSPLIKRSFLDAVGGYDTTLIPHGAEDWKLYLALSAICDFAVIPEHLVGYRQSTGSLSRNVAGLAQSIELVDRWLSERWPNLPEGLARQRLYYSGICLAHRALDNNQFVAAMRYGASALKARPDALLDRSTLEVVGRLFFRMTGLRRPMFKRLHLRPSVSFRDFQSVSNH
jgi:glycosyltransferase involved in cell wall biosynthesis